VPGVFKAYTGALEKLLAYQTQQAKAWRSSRPASSRAAVPVDWPGRATLVLGAVLACC
jgi:methyl-accepting chemotaxis protein